MSPAPDSSIVDPQEIIADLQRELAECRAKLGQRSAEFSEALEQADRNGRGAGHHQLITG